MPEPKPTKQSKPNTSPRTESLLASEFEKISIQGLDPIFDEGIGFSWFARFGHQNGISPFPKFLRAFLRQKVWPLVINEPELNGVFMDRLFLWTAIHFPMWVYFLVFADYTNHPIIFGLTYAVYFVLWFDQMMSYVLALHCVAHGPIFKTSNAVGRGLKWFFVWIIGPMMGETPETYAAHHIAMHHPTNNSYDDLSTTMTYVRDSKWDFARYLGRFLVVHFELFNQLKVRNPIVARRFVFGEICWMSVGALLYYYRPFTTALLYVLPVFVLRVGMTCGNWAQHAFLNNANPFDNHNQSISIVNSMYNTAAFNDGYHIQHHEHPIAPYYDLPLLWIKMLPAMAKHDSVVLNARGSSGGAVFDFVSIWVLLMTKNYEVLADHFVDCRAIVNKTEPRPKEEIIKLLKDRTWRTYDEKTTPPPKKH